MAYESCISGTVQPLKEVMESVTKGKVCVICCTESAFLRAQAALSESGNRTHVDVTLLRFEGVDQKKYDTLFLYGDRTGDVTKVFFNRGIKATLVADTIQGAMAQAQLIYKLGSAEYQKQCEQEHEEAKKLFRWVD